MPKTIPQISIESQMLIKKLDGVAEGEVITYADLSHAIGRDVQTSARGSLTTARNRLARDEGIYFEPIVRVGLRRCKDEDKAQAGTATIKKIGAAARRGVRKLASVQSFEKLPRELQTEHNASMSMLGALAATATVKKLTTLQKAVDQASAILPLAKTLEVLTR